MGILFIVIGNYLGKIRSNYMMGIRTPWTLSSDLAWDKTHRLGGKLFMLAGLLLLLSALFLPVTWWVYVMLGTLFPMLIVLFVYSYLVWRTVCVNRFETVRFVIVVATRDFKVKRDCRSAFYFGLAQSSKSQAPYPDMTFSSVWGGLIQTADGSWPGTGWPRTNRSGLAR